MRVVAPRRYLALPLVNFFLAAQSIPPDEIRSRIVPYVSPAPATLRIEARIVEVPVVVRDAQHRAVAGLTRDDFELRDQGTRQTITGFTAAGAGTGAQPQPRFIALCFDDLHLSPATLLPAKAAADRFVRGSLAPGDRAAILTTSQSNKSAFTGDVSDLAAQIARITAAHQGATGDLIQCPRLQPYEAYQISEHMDPGDRLLQAKVAECAVCSHHACPESLIASAAGAVWANTRSSTSNTLSVLGGAVKSMAKLPGQRILLLTSAGFLTESLETGLDRLMDQARHAGVVINALDARGVRVTSPDSGGMAALASGTGGEFYQNQNDLEQGLRELGLAPAAMYVLAFSPTGSPDGRFHKLTAQLVSPAAGTRYTLQARLGYTSTGSATHAGVPLSALDREVAASGTLADLPVSFSWEQWAGPPGITLVARLDFSRLHFKPWQDRRTQRFIIVAALMDSQGAMLAAKRSELDLSLRDATFARFEKAGFPVAMTLPAPPGSYSVRAVAQDGVENKFTAAGGTVQIK